ncbi:RagB/SusD family nutrient uptake outer membrane protein [Chitinophaga horti]|uniref:RagB/SusD family nutrient uptake outer membrane protein n=1 Tax=Chitinophaga horti TaxID=2920382 RepID=A0ABY6IVG5_9BACT|nr:RagB/SusD family nutrient uptake outer membrane protein [Chitinophaga horti]UYQ91358.1 RagB/SusD family nutrient uptake outer membrane protein [Chitinophaga horti]
MKKIFSYILLGCLSLHFSACKDFLDLEPISTATDQNFWKNEAEANSGTAAMYALLRKAFNAGENGTMFFDYGDFPSDEFNTARMFGDSREIALMNWSLPIQASNTWRSMMVARRYDNFYRVIDQANRCIKWVPTVPLDKFTSSNAERARNSYLGEAYFMRAFTYFYMARVWGDVPVVLKSADNIADAEDLPRSPQTEVLAQALKDVDLAIANMQYTNPNAADAGVRANKSAAFALKAHIYAWMGDYAKCVPAADSVIERGGLALADRSNVPAMFAKHSTEGIFEIAMSDESEGTVQGISFYTLRTPYMRTILGNPSFGIDTVRLHRLFADTTDLRLRSGFAFYNSTEEAFCIKYSNVVYMLPNNTGAVSRNNLVVFRLSDIILLRAEALAATNQYGKARTDLDLIRSRAGIGASAATDGQLFEEIMEERARELYLEGHRFFDIIRLLRKTGTNKISWKLTETEFAQGKYYWPLDPVLINLSARLTQTAYWSTKF